MNNWILLGVVALIAGIIILVYPSTLSLIVALALIILGAMWIYAGITGRHIFRL